jgi:protein-tyrosine phosphatase
MGSLSPRQRLSSLDDAPSSESECLSQTRSVLFVCRGNLCRSPAGASVLQKYLEKNRFPHHEFYIDSAGVEVVALDAKPTFAMRWAAFRRGYRLKQRARCVRRPELDEFDLVIAMDRKVLNSLNSLNCFHESPSAKINLLSDFLPHGRPRDIPDPMFRSTRTCNKVLDLLENACPHVVNYLVNRCNPMSG